MTDTFEPASAEALGYGLELPYAFDGGTRTLYAFALQSRYLESGSWPVDGLSIPEEMAQAYMNDPDRDSKIITRSGEAFSIVDA